LSIGGEIPDNVKNSFTSQGTKQMKNNDTRVCIVGAGSFASRRIYPYLGPAGTKLLGICTRSLASSQLNAERYGGNQYTDLDKMLDTEKPDCVIACVGPAEHPELAIRIMEKGYPVYTEKPQALDSGNSFRMAEVSNTTGQLCSIAYKKRYATVFDRAKKWIKSFPTERLSSISIDCASGPFENTEQGNSFLMQCGIHIIDLIIFLYGDVSKLLCFAKGMNAYAINMTFASGAIGTMNLGDTGSMAVPTEEMEIGIEGGNFMRIHNGSEYKICESEKCVEWREPTTFMSSGDSGHDTGILTELIDFFAAVREGRTTRSNIFESCKTLLLYEAILESVDSGQIVEIDYSGIPISSR
jgi:predicted dehydrogenase